MSNKGMDWIKKAIKRPGALRKALGAKKGQDIPANNIPVILFIQRCHHLSGEATHLCFVNWVSDIILPHSLSNAEIRPTTGV